METGSPQMGETQWPEVSPVGLSGLLVRFGDKLDPVANQAAIACRAGLEAEGWPEVAETASALASVILRIDLAAHDETALTTRLQDWLAARDWSQPALPEGRSLWSIPAVFGGAYGPQIEEVAALGGATVSQCIEEVTETRLRVLALGFAPGQPYLGFLPDRWDIPRQTGVTAKVPAGAIVLAVRQIVMFANASPTGWRQIAQTGFKCYQPGAEDPLPLRPGDELRYVPVKEDALDTPASSEPLP